MGNCVVRYFGWCTGTQTDYSTESYVSLFISERKPAEIFIYKIDNLFCKFDMPLSRVAILQMAYTLIYKIFYRINSLKLCNADQS